jgi:hypothetical protein
MSSMFRGSPFVVPSNGSRLAADSAVQALLADEWPVLSVVLGGGQAGEGVVASPACSIILKIDNGRLGFCICPETGSDVAFGVVGDPTKGFSGLEWELAQGNYGWRPKRAKRS